MTAILNQRRFFLTKKFETTDRSLRVSIKTPVSYVEDEFAFEDITTKYNRKKSINWIIGGLLLFCLLGVIITVISHLSEKDGSSTADILFYCGGFVVFLVILLLSFENIVNIHLQNGRILKVYATSPNEKEVESYLANLRDEQKKYLLKNYAKDDPYLPREQLNNNLQWLWNRRFVDTTELENLKKALLDKNNPDSGVGFKFNQSAD
jgi:hypothetical protein